MVKTLEKTLKRHFVQVQTHTGADHLGILWPVQIIAFEGSFRSI